MHINVHTHSRHTHTLTVIILVKDAFACVYTHIHARMSIRSE